MIELERDAVRALADCLRACQHTLTAAVQKGGEVQIELACGCTILAKLQAAMLERLLDLETQKKRRPPVVSRRRGSSP